MAITRKGVKFLHKYKQGAGLFLLLGILEVIFTAFLVISMSAEIWMPKSASAAAGVSDLLSYQGRLTDAAGSPLGGAGTDYCFRFSIWDMATGGTANPNQLWPAGFATPSNSTIDVTNGVFNAGIGQNDDLSAYSFYDNDTIYLNVEVAAQTASSCTGVSYESLSPRQQISAVAYARVARDVYGDLLRTLNADNRVQIGLGTGSASPVLLRLDFHNDSDTIGGDCTTNGTMWYNSINTRALVCDNGHIQTIGNASSDLIVGIKENSSGSVISSGTVVFSAGDNITINQAGQTLEFVGPEAGAGTPASYWANMQNIHSSTMAGFGQSTSTIMPFFLPYDISLGYIRLIAPMTGTASTTVATTKNVTLVATMASSWNAVIYAQNVGLSSQSLKSYASGQGLFQTVASLSVAGTGASWTQEFDVTYPRGTSTVTAQLVSRTANSASFNWATNSLTAFTGTKFIDIPLNTSLAAGNYWMMIGSSSNTSTNATNATGNTNCRVSNNGSIYAAFQSISVFSSLGQMGVSSATSNQMSIGFGSFTLNGAAGTTDSLGLANISLGASHNLPYFQLINQS